MSDALKETPSAGTLLVEEDKEKKEPDVVSINVAVRCRPFAQDGKLACFINQEVGQQGEIRLVNVDGMFVRQTRFGFTYAWWSAPNFKHHLTDEQDLHLAEQMKLTTQTDVHEHVGKSALRDLLTGHSVVMFAYGLSGSGKTYTVFGPDDPIKPEAWFKHKDVHEYWGLFPRIAHALFTRKEEADGMRVSVKYFQNVVNTVRDLLSSSGEEQSDKSGLHKDASGFMDVNWCSTMVINTWEDLRLLIMDANKRKAIAPTQFNHQSTRGHCILILEVETTNQEMHKQKGRLYICDLAGAEPAGDIVHAVYAKNSHGEDVYKGPHPDPLKTKALRAQGQKINLSLSEMTNFFRKMAAEAKANRLKPGQSIPGCNNYFLGRFLKDTMLKSKTYLFCAMRPEAAFTRYTVSTLQFADTASVVQLKPKKPLQRKMSPKEQKLFNELQTLKEMLKEANRKKRRPSQVGKDNDDGDIKEEINAKRRQIDAQNQRPLTVEERLRQTRAEEQRVRMKKRGITFSIDKRKRSSPHFTNIDEDEFISERFVYYLLNEEEDALSNATEAKITVFGVGGDVEPKVQGLVEGHCYFRTSKVGKEGSVSKTVVTLHGGKGPVVHNGNEIEQHEEVVLANYDRVAIGKLFLLFIHEEDDSQGKRPTVDSVIDELSRSLEKMNKSAAGKEFNPGLLALQSKMQILKGLLVLLGRDDVVDVEMYIDEDIHENCEDYGNEFKCRARIHGGGDSWHVLDTEDLDRCTAILEQEKVALKNAFESGTDYNVPVEHDPVNLLFDEPQRVGYAILSMGPSMVDQIAQNDMLSGLVIAPDKGVPILDPKKPHDKIGTLFMRVEFGWVVHSMENENHVTEDFFHLMDKDGSGDLDADEILFMLQQECETNISIDQVHSLMEKFGTTDEMNFETYQKFLGFLKSSEDMKAILVNSRKMSMTVTVHHAEMPYVVSQASYRYVIMNETFDCEAILPEASADPDFDNTHIHVFPSTRDADKRILLNVYCTQKRIKRQLMPLATSSPKVLRSFELHNEIGVSHDGLSAYDQIYALKNQLKDSNLALKNCKERLASDQLSHEEEKKRFQNRIKTLETETKSALETIASLRADLAQKSNACTVLETSNRTLEEAIFRTTADCDALHVKLEKESAEHKLANDHWRKRLDAKINDLREAIVERDTMGENLKISESITQNLRDELAEKTQLFQNSIMEKTSEIAGFYSQILDKNAKISRVEMELQHARKDLEARMSELANFRESKTAWLLKKKTAVLDVEKEHSKEREQRAKEALMEQELKLLKEKLNLSETKRFDMEKLFKEVEARKETERKKSEQKLIMDSEAKMKRVVDKQIKLREQLGEREELLISQVSVLQKKLKTTKRQALQAVAQPAEQVGVVALSTSTGSSVVKTKTASRAKKAASPPAGMERLDGGLPVELILTMSNLTVANLDTIYKSLANIPMQSTKHVLHTLSYVVDCCLRQRGEKLHLYTTLLEQLLGRNTATRWIQNFVHTAVINTKTYWRDGVDGRTFGPFVDSTAALKNAVMQTSPSKLLLQKCLDEFQNADSGFTDRILRLVELLSSLFDRNMVPGNVMQEILDRLILSPINARGGGRIVSATLEIAFRSMNLGCLKEVDRLRVYLQSVEEIKGMLNSRDLFIYNKLTSHQA